MRLVKRVCGTFVAVLRPGTSHKIRCVRGICGDSATSPSRLVRLRESRRMPSEQQGIPISGRQRPVRMALSGTEWEHGGAVLLAS
jgi:hypothetical protein